MSLRKKNKPKSNIENKNPENPSIALWKRENMEFFLSPLGKATIPSIEKIADDMLDFVLANPKCMHLDDFYLSKGLTYDTFHNWLGKSDVLQAKYSLCMEMLGLRRQKLLSKTNPNTLIHTLYQHSPAWDKADKRNEEIRNKDNNNNSNKIVVIEKYAETKEVPNKPLKGNE